MQDDNQPKSIGQIVNLHKLKDSTTTASTESVTPQKIISRRIEELFLGLAGIFHVSFTSRFPTPESRYTAKVMWEMGLNDLSDKELYGALKKCTSWEKDFPPTLAQFRQLATYSSERTHHDAYKVSEYTGLPSPPRTEESMEIANHHLNTMREILKNINHSTPRRQHVTKHA